MEVDRGHLEERLGLFVIIVLGESVIQVVHAAAARPWTSSFEVTALAAFGLLFGLWRQTFAHGFSGAPHSSLAGLEPRYGLPLHLLSTAGLVAVAAALAELLAQVGGTDGPSRGIVALLGGGLAAHFLVGLVAGAAGVAPRAWLWSRAVPAVVWSVLLALTGGVVGPGLLVVLAALPALWLGSGEIDRRRTAAGNAVVSECSLT